MHAPYPLFAQALVPLTTEERRVIRRDGPIVEDWAAIVPLLQPAQVRADLSAITRESCGLLRAAAQTAGCAGVGALSLPQIARALFGREKVDPGGRTPMRVLPLIYDCDTKSYADNEKIWTHLEREVCM